MPQAREASKADWLRKRPDMQGEEMQRLLADLEKSGYPDKLLPWILREIKKKQLEVERVIPETPPTLYYRTLPYEHADGSVEEGDRLAMFSVPIAQQIEEMQDELKKRRQGIDVMKHSVSELTRQLWTFQDQKAAEDRKEMGEPVQHYEDGWTMRQLKNGREAKDEGERMGHCAGGYADQVDQGETLLYSLRDEKNMPHATIEIIPQAGGVDWHEVANDEEYIDFLAKKKWTPDILARIGRQYERVTNHHYYGGDDWLTVSDERIGFEMSIKDRQIFERLYNEAKEKYPPSPEGGTCTQVFGKEDQPLTVPHYLEKVRSFFDEFEEKPIFEPSYMEPWEHQWEHPDDLPDDHDYDKHFYPPELQGETYGLEGQGYPDIWYDFDNLVDNAGEGHYGQWGNDHSQKIYELAKHQDAIPDLAAAAQRRSEELFDEEFGHMEGNIEYIGTEPEKHEFEDEDEYDEAYASWEERRDEISDDFWSTGHPGQVREIMDYLAPHYDQARQKFVNNHIQKPTTFSRVAGAAPSKPFCYRWVYRPSDGAVTVTHDFEDHPAYTRYHGELADEHWEPNTYFGNAFRIKGGWRILDGDHKPVDDPYIIRQVLAAIKGEEGVPEEEPDWSEAIPEAGFDKLHYGQPMGNQN